MWLLSRQLQHIGPPTVLHWLWVAFSFCSCATSSLRLCICLVNLAICQLLEPMTAVAASGVACEYSAWSEKKHFHLAALYAAVVFVPI